MYFDEALVPYVSYRYVVLFRIVITVIAKSKNFDDDGTRTHILRSEV